MAHGTEALGDTNGNTCSINLEGLEKILELCSAKRIPMVVANPDYVTVEPGNLFVMPGTLADKYEKLGGEVKLMGKPHEIIYNSAMVIVGRDVFDCIVVGDSLHHYIKGTNVAGIQSILITQGIHETELGLHGFGEVADSSYVQSLAIKYNACPSYVLPTFTW